MLPEKIMAALLFNFETSR